jgi:acetyltransferase-like isoleucine patch superfamily enzyme
MISKIKRKLAERKYLKSFLSHGEGVFVDYPALGSFQNVKAGSRVYIGPDSFFMAKNAAITIGNDVLMGPEVMIITGDHRFDLVGRTMYSLTEKDKLPQNDQPVSIGNDVWIGARAIILKGVTIGDGAIVGVLVRSLQKTFLLFLSWPGTPLKLLKNVF